MSESIVIRSFAAGELAPALAARADLAKYTIGLRTCRNFLVQRHGGAANRGGTRFIEAAKTTSIETRLLRYVSEIAGESVLIEHGVGYFRFFQNGALVTIENTDVTAWGAGTAYEIGDLALSGGVVYYCKVAHTNQVPPNATYWYPMPSAGGGFSVFEVFSPYSDPRGTKWVQSGRVISFTHPEVRPYDLIFVSLTQWVMRPVVTEPKVAAPTGVAFTPAAGARSYGYIVTAAHPLTYEESLPSAAVVNAASAEPTPDAPHAITWNAVLTPPTTGDPSPEYYVYCDPYGNGTYGFIGTATGAAAFNNPGLTPDFTQTPQLERDLFNAADQYPAVCAYHQQRRFFARTNENPDGVFASRVGFPDNFGISSPLQDDDALEFRVAGNNHHPVQDLVALKNLLVMTGAGEWRLVGANGVLTPSTLELDQETYVGLYDNVRPVVIGNSVLYVQARGSIVRELRFDQDVEGWAGRDLTVYSAHLFDGKTIEAMDYAQVPHSILWCCRSDGSLLGLTYLVDQDMWAWHRHDTGASGRFEDVCVVPELDGDAVYVLVRRTIGGAFVRYIEKLEDRQIDDWNVDSFFVDSGLSYSGAATSSVTGLAHLAGQVVRAVGDGEDLGTFTVSAGGSITLSDAYSEIHVGLPITADLETLDLDIAGSAVRDKKKRVGSVTLILESSSRAFSVGASSSALQSYTPGSTDSPATVSFTGQVEVNIPATWNDNGRVFVRQTVALPLTVLGIIPNVELGG